MCYLLVLCEKEQHYVIPSYHQYCSRDVKDEHIKVIIYNFDIPPFILNFIFFLSFNMFLYGTNELFGI